MNLRKIQAIARKEYLPPHPGLPQPLPGLHHSAAPDPAVRLCPQPGRGSHPDRGGRSRQRTLEAAISSAGWAPQPISTSWRIRPPPPCVTDLLDHSRGRSSASSSPPAGRADLRADRKSPLQILIDGSDPNIAGITRAFITAFIAQANEHQLLDFFNRQGREQIRPPVEGRIRVWFNEDLESRNFIVPGIIAIIIMIVGAMLTSLVIAREYENGTMETIRSLPVRAGEFFMGKAIPYFFIALVDVLVAILMGQVLFGVVMKSSFWLMILASSIYIVVALAIGLLISIETKSQLVANQLAVLVTYLPSLLLSNFVFPQQNMPALLKAVTQLVPGHLLHRYPERLVPAGPVVPPALAELPGPRRHGSAACGPQHPGAEKGGALT